MADFFCKLKRQVKIAVLMGIESNNQLKVSTE